VKGIPCTALIYAQSSHYFNTVTGDQIPVGTPVGVKFGEHEGAPSVLFKDLVKIKENPRKYKKVLDMAARVWYNILALGGIWHGHPSAFLQSMP